MTGDLMIAGDELTVAGDDDVDTIRTIGAPAKFSFAIPPETAKNNLRTFGRAFDHNFAPTPINCNYRYATSQQSGNIIRSDAIIYDLNAQKFARTATTSASADRNFRQPPRGI